MDEPRSKVVCNAAWPCVTSTETKPEETDQARDGAECDYKMCNISNMFVISVWAWTPRVVDNPSRKLQYWCMGELQTHRWIPQRCGSVILLPIIIIGEMRSLYSDKQTMRHCGIEKHRRTAALPAQEHQASAML